MRLEAGSGAFGIDKGFGFWTTSDRRDRPGVFGAARIDPNLGASRSPIPSSQDSSAEQPTSVSDDVTVHEIPRPQTSTTPKDSPQRKQAGSLSPNVTEEPFVVDWHQPASAAARPQQRTRAG
jgi:hypothetical protein